MSATHPVAAVYDFFNTADHEFAAVLDGDRVVGVCGRSHIRSLLAGRYGFALHSRAPVREHVLRSALIVHCATPLRELLEQAVGRDGDAFYEDVALIDDSRQLVGLISTRRLVKEQSELIKSQFTLLESQHRHLETTNRNLASALEQQRQLEAQMIAREKASVVETLAGGIAHELNNKLMPILGYSELLLEALVTADNPAAEVSCQTIHAAALDSSRIIRQLLQLSRPPTTERTDCLLRDLVDQALALVNLRLKEGNIAVTLEWPDQPIYVHVDGSQIRQVVTNLVLNAMDAMMHASHRELRINLSADLDQARLTVSDTGSGIAADVLPRIFDPFFTTKGPKQGTGLGLSVSQSIVHAHGGQLSARSTVGAGTTFAICLPIRDLSTMPAAPPRIGASPRHEDSVVLVVEDDEAVAHLVSHALGTRLGCAVVRAEDGDAACRLLGQSNFDLILSDVRMPGMGGAALLSWIVARRPDLREKIVFLTGDDSDSKDNSVIRRSGAPLLRKPLAMSDLLARASDILARRT